MGAARRGLVVRFYGVWLEFECLPFAQAGFGDSDRGGMECLSLCVLWWGEYRSL